MRWKLESLLVLSLLLAPQSAALAQQAANSARTSDESRSRPGRRPLHDFAGTAVDLARDFWRTFSAPAWMDRGAWLQTAGVLAVSGVMFAYDEEIMDAILRNRKEPVFEQIEDVGAFLEPVGLMGNTNKYYAGAAVLSWAVGLDRPKRMFTELLYSHWIAGVIRGGANYLVGRTRPRYHVGARNFELGEGTSFPSGHASTAFQVATVLSHHLSSTPVSVLLYALAGAQSWERMTSEEHWASDVWLGAAYGWAVAKLVIRLHEEEALRIEATPGPPGSPGLGLRFSF